jgi:5-methyltetrahydropteroyltriglutamate--homocysteine methyltransferase
MRRSSDRILTSLVGSLPRSDELIAANRAREIGVKKSGGERADEAAFQQMLRASVAEIVRQQQGLGIDVPNDGEFGKSVTHRVHYGAWWSYALQRWGGSGGPAPLFPSAMPA